MKKSRRVYLRIGLLMIWLLTSTVLRTNAGSTIRLFSDDYDRYFYFLRGSWFVDHQVPYRDTISEYPQVPTYLFGVLHVADIGETNDSIAYWKYTTVFALLMLMVLLATIELLEKMLPKGSALAYLFLLPAPLYFSINRFDILPAYLTLLSIKMVQDKRWDAVALLLGVGALTKWYPALLLPAYMLYYYQTTRRLPWRMALLFFLTCVLLVLPTLLAGGVDALAVPYRFHMERGLESVSLPTLLSKLLNHTLQIQVSQKTLSLVFLLLQIAVVPLLVFVRMDHMDKLLNACILVISAFVLFSRIYSPQWLLWLLPFCILAAGNWVDIGTLALFSITAYISFPIVWDYFGPDSFPMILTGIVHIVLVILIMSRALYRIRYPVMNSAERPEPKSGIVQP